MSMEEMNTIISRAASDTSYRVRFFEHFDAAVGAYDITPTERMLLKRVTPDKFDMLFKKLEEWGQPLSVASMDLLQLIYGEQLQDVPHEVSPQGSPQPAPTSEPKAEPPKVEKPKEAKPEATPRPKRGISRRLLIFVGVVLIGVIAAVVLIMALGSVQGGTPDATVINPTAPADGSRIISTSGPASCRCVCVEECREGAISCLTVCKDCEENRCVP